MVLNFNVSSSDNYGYFTDPYNHINPYWTGKTYMSFPGKGQEGYICPTIVTSRWRQCDVILAHLERHALGGATKIITLWSGGP